jgi:hypothetical protein
MSAATNTGSSRPGWVRSLSRQNIASTLFAGYVPMILALLIIALPLLWMILASFKPIGEIVTADPGFWPKNPTVDNYASVADRVPLARVFLNSVIVTLVGAAIKVFLAITTAYALVFIEIPFRNAIFLGILVALMVPPEAAMLPNFLSISAIGGRDGAPPHTPSRPGSPGLPSDVRKGAGGAAGERGSPRGRGAFPRGPNPPCSGLNGASQPPCACHPCPCGPPCQG